MRAIAYNAMMPVWIPIKIPYIAERYIAFSIPDETHFLAVSYEGVHEIVLGDDAVINSDFSLPEGKGFSTASRLRTTEIRSERSGFMAARLSSRTTRAP